MSVVPHFLLASGTLTTHVREITQICNEVVGLVSPLIHLPDCDVVFRDYPEGTIAGYGVGGRALNCHEIAVALDFQEPSFSSMMYERVRRILLHELHHVTRMAKTGPWKSLGENIVSEGLAQCFVEMVDYSPSEPWSVALSELELSRFTDMVKTSFNDMKYDHALWFYGTEPLQIPRWTGYSVGYALVKNYLQKHPQETAATLFDFPAEKFI